MRWLHSFLQKPSTAAVDLSGQGLDDGTVLQRLDALADLDQLIKVNLASNRLTSASLRPIVHWMERQLQSNVDVWVDLSINQIGGEPFFAIVKAMGHPDWTETSRITVAPTFAARATEQLAARLFNSGSDCQTVQKELSAALLQSNQTTSAHLDRLAQSNQTTSAHLDRLAQSTSAHLDRLAQSNQTTSAHLDRLAQSTSAHLDRLAQDLRTLTSSVENLVGHASNLDTQIEQDVTAAVKHELQQQGFTDFAEVPGNFCKFYNQQGIKLVEWDGIFACNSAELKLLVLVEAKSFLRQEHLTDKEVAQRIKTTKDFLSGVQAHEQPPQGSHKEHQRLHQFLRNGFLSRKLVLAVGAPALPFNLEDAALAGHCIVARLRASDYAVNGVDDAIRHAV